MLHSALRPTRHRLIVAFAILACGIGRFGVAAVAAEASKDDPEVVAPVEFGGTAGKLGPITTGGTPSRALPIAPIGSIAPVGSVASIGSTAPLGSMIPIPAVGLVGKKGENLGKVGFDLSSVKRDTALLQVKVGALTLEAAWQNGDLNYDNIADLLEHPADPWVINERKTDNGLHHQLIELLLQHEGKRLEDLPKVSQRVRLWLADYYGARGNVKIIKVAQSLLDEFPPPSVDAQMFAYQARERVAWFYRDQRQHQKSAETWLQWKDYQGGPSWALTNAKLEAARQLEKAGPENAEKVSQMRQELVAQKDGWTTALVYYDEYNALLSAGKPEAARRALSKPIEATSSVAEGRIAQNAWLANIAYQSGDLNETLRLTKEAMAQNMEGVGQASVKGLIEQARELYNRAGGWRTQPIQTDTKEVVFQANPSQPEAPLYARFRIKTYGDTSVTASVDNPNIKARILPVNNWRREGLSAQEEEMEVIVQSNSLNKFNDVPLVLSSATRGKTTTVRLSLVERPARLPSQQASENAKAQRVSTLTP